MRLLLPCLILLVTVCSIYGQSYHRPVFDYDSLPEAKDDSCQEGLIDDFEAIQYQIETNNSTAAVARCEALIVSNSQCPYVWERYAWALFRNGQRTEGIAVIDSLIPATGRDEILINRRAHMSIELAELGPSEKSVDGNGVYVPASKSDAEDEELFKSENYKAALADFTYLSSLGPDRHLETYAVGYITQQLGDYETSNHYLKQLIGKPQFHDLALYSLIDNHLAQGTYHDAEALLKELESTHPRNLRIYQKMEDLYELQGDSLQAQQCRQKAAFYTWAPEYTGLSYTDELYSTFSYFESEAPPKSKLKRLKTINKMDEAEQVAVYIVLLNMHANHGIGLEEKAEEQLTKIGSPAVPQLILLMYNAGSTCTVTRSASALAEIKDPEGWQPMVDYLPRIEHMPVTLIPPEIPEQLVKFDREKALPVILNWLKGDLGQEEAMNSDDPMDELKGMFAYLNAYIALKAYDKEEVEVAAKALDYSPEQLQTLLEKLEG